MTDVLTGRLPGARALAAELSDKWFVDGEFASATETYSLPSPAVRGAVITAADVSAAEALRAAETALQAQAAWAEVAAMQRTQLVRQLTGYLESRRDELAEMIVFEAGKPIAHARAEVDFCLRVLDTLCASVAEVGSSSRLDFMTGRRVTTFYRPVGPALLVTPWNFPLNLGVRKLATALLAGCTVVWKPSERTPLTALLVAQGLRAIGLPAGVAAVVPTGRSPEVTSTLMRSGLLRKLSFTGSTAVGKILMVEAAEQVMRTSFELGGNGPAIVGHGADLEAAVPAIIRAKFVNNGQVCTTVNRLYVPAPRADAIADRLGSELDGIVVGWPDDEQTVVGPLISETSALTLTRSLEQAAAHGALVSQHGNPPPSGGNFVRPSLVRNVSTDDNLAQRELFGPVLTLISYEDLPTAIAEANATPYGLSAYVFSNDVTELDLCTARLRAGMIAINSPSPSSVSTPFGGIGWSGYGRENGVRGITEFMDETTLVH